MCRRLVLGAELFDARTAVELDIFDEIVDDERVLDRATAVARQLAAHPVHLRGREAAIAGGRSIAGGLFGGAKAAGRRWRNRPSWPERCLTREQNKNSISLFN